jgi:hypothetical protein
VDPEAYAASDSAGVRLVRYTREPAVPAWTAVEPATLQLGGEDSFERITGGTLLPDGGVLAADGLAARVTILDSAGGIRQQIGRSGDGPLEFRNLAWARPYAGDSIATFDLALRRLMVFDPAGGPGRVVTLSPTGDGSRPTALGLFTGGEIPVLATGVLYADHLAPGIHAPRTHLWRYAADGRPAAPVRTDLAGAEMVQLESPRILMSRPFGKETAVAAGAALVFVADSGGSLLEAYHADGSLAMLLRLPAAARPVTETHRAAYRRQRLAPLREAALAEPSADGVAAAGRPGWSALGGAVPGAGRGAAAVLGRRDGRGDRGGADPAEPNGLPGCVGGSGVDSVAGRDGPRLPQDPPDPLNRSRRQRRWPPASGNTVIHFLATA